MFPLLKIKIKVIINHFKGKVKTLQPIDKMDFIL
jgi:hypothetical protein